jgi:hypothetical protein
MQKATRAKLRYRRQQPAKVIHVRRVFITSLPHSTTPSPLPDFSPVPPCTETKLDTAVLLDSLGKNDTSPAQNEQWLQYGGEQANPDVVHKHDEPPAAQPPPPGMLPLPPEEIEPSEDCISYAEWQNLSTSPLYPGSTMTALEGILLTHQFLIHANMNKSTSEELLKLMSSLLPAPSLLPPSYYMLMKVHTTT